MEKQYNPLASANDSQSISPPSSVPSPGDLKQDFYDQMAGSLIQDKTFGQQPKINVTRKSEFKMPDMNLEYIKGSSSMSNFLN
jgi:hypothetical protein